MGKSRAAALRAHHRELSECGVLTRANKVENAVLKEINGAKKQAIKRETVDSAAALEAVLSAFLTADEKSAKAREKFVKAVEKKCASLSATADTIFPGACADTDLGVVEDCVFAAARCEACLKTGAFDDLDLDCDDLDDGTANMSCPYLLRGTFCSGG